jgi:glycolate oxidase
MEKDIIKNELIRIVGSKNVFTEKTQRLCYRFGNVVEYRLNPPTFLPDFVVKPSSTRQISSILKLANKHRIPVVVWGGGTDFTGANSSIKGGIVIDMKGLNKIHINREEKWVTAGAGTPLLKITEEAEKKGFLFEHEIASQPSATLGGAIATNSFGYRSGKYRYIRNLILGIEAVLPTGEIIRTKPLFKTSIGYDLISLFVGSEGTLGIVTEATLRLSSKPESREVSSYLFSTFESALNAAKKLYEILTPDFFELFELSFMRYLNSDTDFLDELTEISLPEDFISIINAKNNYPAILTVGFEGMKDVVKVKKKLSKRLLGDSIKIKDNYYKRRFIRYHEDFKNILNLVPNISLQNLTYASFDISLPVSKIMEINENVHEIAKEQSNIYLLDIDLYSSISVVGVDFLIPLDDPKTYLDLSKNIYAQALKFGGSISAIHGIGTRLLPYLEQDIGKEYKIAMNKIKSALDPSNILNPGKLGDGN